MPPEATAKKVVPTSRSSSRRSRATVITGKARRMRTYVTSVIQANTGRRSMVMPGARILMMVTSMFRAPVVDEIPRIYNPRTQKSMPSPGLN
jgi:hypothetical protein